MEVVVVSDTSPIRALAHLGLLDVLGTLYRIVFVPLAVESELKNPKSSCKPVDLDKYDFFEFRKAGKDTDLEGVLSELDPGETEAILLAKELGIRGLLMDELAGRDKAVDLGLRVLGTIGVLLRAKEIGRINAVSPLLDELQKKLNFFISKKLRATALRLAGEEA